MKPSMIFRESSAITKRLALLLVLLISISGCTTKVAYHFLDWGISWRINKYVNLNKDQQEFTGEQLNQFHAWHKQTQLVVYAKYIEGLKQTLASNKITGDILHAKIDELQLLADVSIAYLTPATIELAASLSDAQVKELLESFAKKREKYKDKHINVSQEKVIKERINELEDKLSPYIGRFTNTQNTWVKDWATSLQPFEELTLKQQEIFAQDLKAALAKRQDKALLKSKLQHLMVTTTDDWPEHTQAIFDKNQQITYDFMAKLLNNLTDKQQQKLNRKLDSYITDLYELAGPQNEGQATTQDS